MSIKDTTQQQREREEEETKKRKREIETGIVKKISYLDMTRRRSSRTPSPPRGDRKMPPGFIPYDGIKEEEIEALKLVFRLDGSNPYKDDPYNVKRFMPNNIKGFMPYKDDPYSIKGFMPMTRYYESDFRAYLTTLHDDNMEVEDKYVAIQDLIKQMFHTQHAWIPPTWASGSRYRYSKSLHTYLHQSEPPSATRRRTGIQTYPIESPKKMKPLKEDEESEEEFDFIEAEEGWKMNTAKRARERDQRMTARQMTKQQLTTSPQKQPSKQRMSVAALLNWKQRIWKQRKQRNLQIWQMQVKQYYIQDRTITGKSTPKN